MIWTFRSNYLMQRITELADGAIKFTIANVLLWSTSTYNENRKNKSHTYIMAQAYWEKNKENNGDIYLASDDQNN